MGLIGDDMFDSDVQVIISDFQNAKYSIARIKMMAAGYMSKTSKTRLFFVALWPDHCEFAATCNGQQSSGEDEGARR